MKYRAMYAFGDVPADHDNDLDALLARLVPHTIADKGVIFDVQDASRRRVATVCCGKVSR